MKGLKGSRIMVLIFSGHANTSEQVRHEVERASSRGMSILAFRLEDVPYEGAMEYHLGNRHWLDAFTPPVEQQLEVLARTVKTLLGVESPQDPRVTGDKPAIKTADVAPTPRPPWVWPSVVVGVSMLGLLAAWLGGVFKVKTPDGVIVLKNFPSETSRKAGVGGIGSLPTSAVTTPALASVGELPAPPANAPSLANERACRPSSGQRVRKVGSSPCSTART